MDMGGLLALSAKLRGSTEVRTHRKLDPSALLSPARVYLLLAPSLGPINTKKKKKKSQIITQTDCRALSYSVSRDTCFLGDMSGLWVRGRVRGGDLSAFSYTHTWQFSTQGSSELTYGDYSILQLKSYLWVLSPETTGRS